MSETQIYSSSAVDIRKYEKLFIGSNQDGGYDSPILSYSSDVKEIVFKADNSTYFHYPKTANSIPLSSSGLIESGAHASYSPQSADKIWKKQANYEDDINWGNSVPALLQNGTFLCAWLSGNIDDPDETPIWKERWYDPGYIDLSGAYVATTPLSTVIVDIDSSMTFDAGVLYRYNHIGSLSNQFFVDTVSGSLVLNYDNWGLTTSSSVTYVTDESGNSNKGEVVLNGQSSIVDVGISKRALSTDRSGRFASGSHIKTPHNDTLSPSGDMSVSFWAYADDWSNVNGKSMVSKDYRGGWGVEYTTGFENSIISLIDSDNGSIAIMNRNYKFFVVKDLPGASNPIAVLVDANQYTWVLDDGLYEGSKHLYKIDTNGDIIDSVNLGLIPGFLPSIEYDYDNDLIVISNAIATFKYSAINTNLVSTLAHSTAYSHSLDLNGDSQYCTYSTCIDMLHDNNGDKFTLRTTGVFNKSNVNIYSDISGNDPKAFACDSDNNIWVLYSNRNIVKISTDGTELYSGTIGDNDTDGDRTICITYDYVDGVYSNYLWIAQGIDRKIYKVDTSGDIVSFYEIGNLGGFVPTVSKNSNGYDWNRKYQYVSYSGEPQVRAVLYMGNDISREKKYTVGFNSSLLVDEAWNHIAFTYDHEANEFSIYINSLLNQTISFDVHDKIYYRYNNPLIVGGSSGKLVSLGVELDDNSLFFDGGIDDVRVYNSTLTNYDLREIFFLKFEYNDMSWNMQTGILNYMEEIERFFKFKMAGNKSQYYNIRLVGLGITDPDTREMIEAVIEDNISKIAPAYSNLYRIIWS